MDKYQAIIANQLKYLMELLCLQLTMQAYKQISTNVVSTVTSTCHPYNFHINHPAAIPPSLKTLKRLASAITLLSKAAVRSCASCPIINQRRSQLVITDQSQRNISLNIKKPRRDVPSLPQALSSRAVQKSKSLHSRDRKILNFFRPP